MVVDIRDIITCFKFGDDQFRGLASAEGQILPFPIDSDGRPYNTLRLPCVTTVWACDDILDLDKAMLLYLEYTISYWSEFAVTL